MSLEAPEYKILIVENRVPAVEQVCQDLLAEAQGQGFSKRDIFAIHLAMEEAFLNAVKHGNKYDSSKKINIKYLFGSDKFDITITDQGGGFEHGNLPDPRRDENLYKPRGRGILLMRSYMDVVDYSEDGSSVRMIKNKSQANGDSEKD